MNSDIVVTIKISGEADKGSVQVGEVAGAPAPSDAAAGLGAAAATAGAPPTPSDALGVGEISAAATAVPSPVGGDAAGLAAGALPAPVGLDQIEQLTTSAGLSSGTGMVPEPEGDG